MSTGATDKDNGGVSAATAPFRSLSPAVWRGSTVLFDSIGDFTRRKERLYDGFSYGTTGTPTSRQLEERIARLEAAEHCIVVPSGQAALCMVLLTLASAGDHILVPDSAYGPLKTFASDWMTRFGLEVTFYPHTIGAGIDELIRPATRLLYLESPGSITMEMQDVPAMVGVARKHRIMTVADNTWASPLGFRPLPHGVDICVEAASKQLGGHSDVLLGSIATNDREIYERLRRAQSTLGQAVSPEDCFLVLRGLETFPVRIESQGKVTLEVANWLAREPAVETVLYPPLPGAPGHHLWKRDYGGGGCVLSLSLLEPTEAAIEAFFSDLKVFSIGASWGGVHSLAALYPADEQATRKYPPTSGPIVRLSIGLEGLDALRGDLQDAFGRFHAAN